MVALGSVEPASGEDMQEHHLLVRLLIPQARSPLQKYIQCG